MKLRDLKGIHWLSGVEAKSDAILFTLDGINYLVEEDPDDGWRSYHKKIIVSKTSPKNTFPPQKVEGRMVGGEDNIIQFFNTDTNKIVLEMGTANYDDWYPCCVLRWYPENLTINLKN